MAQCPICRTVQSVRHITYLPDLSTQTLSQILWEASSHMQQLIRIDWSYICQSQYIARESFIQLTNLEHCALKNRRKKPFLVFNTAAHVSNRYYLNRETAGLPLRHCARYQ